MAPDEIFSYIPTPEHPKRLKQMLPVDAEEGLALLAFYRDSFINACTKKDQNTADCVLDIIIHLRYRLIKLGEFLEDPASHLFAIYYEQTLPCMMYGTPLKIDFSPAYDLCSLMDEIDIDEGICVADDAVDFKFGDVDMSLYDSPVEATVCVETKKVKKAKKKLKLPNSMALNKDDAKKSSRPVTPRVGVKKTVESKLPSSPKKGPSKKNDFYPRFKSPYETLPNLNLAKDRNRALFLSTAEYMNGKKENLKPEDLGVIECDILDCLDDLVVCSRGKEAVKLLEVLHPVDVVDDGTICVTKKRDKIGYEAFDHLFRGCPSSRDWLLSRRL